MLDIEEILGNTIKCTCLNEFLVATETYVEDIFDGLESESTSGDIVFTEIKCGEVHLCPFCQAEHKLYIFPWNVDDGEIYVMLENGTYTTKQKLEDDLTAST